MVYGFVRQSDGHVTIYSEPGQGTTVRIYLPRLVGGEEEEERRAPAELPRAEAHETVLVVEDDAEVRAYSVESLRSLDYRVIEAGEATAALAALDARPEISLLFTDVGLPGLDGRKLADEALRRRPNLPVLFTTGYARNAIAHNNVLEQGLHLLTKPFTIEQLATKIRAVLGEGRAPGPDREPRGTAPDP